MQDGIESFEEVTGTVVPEGVIKEFKITVRTTALTTCHAEGLAFWLPLAISYLQRHSQGTGSTMLRNTNIVNITEIG